MLISQQARAGIPVNHDFHPERVPNHQEWSSYSTTVTLSSSERQEHMFLLKRPDHMRCGHASIPRFPTLVGMLYTFQRIATYRDYLQICHEICDQPEFEPLHQTINQNVGQP